MSAINISVPVQIIPRFPNFFGSRSFVICSLQSVVEKLLEKMELLEVMNVTLTESEAWDIVQMEEIERELLGDE